MSPLALCKNCPSEFICVEEGCEFMRRAGPQVITLNEEQWADFMHNMLNPKPPTPQMIAAAEMMRKLSRARHHPGDLEYDSWHNAAGEKDK